MKKLFTILTTLALLCAVGCEEQGDDNVNPNDKPDTEQPGEKPDNIFFGLDKESVSISPDGGSVDVIVYSNYKWEISGISDWCTPSATSGEANEDGQKVTFSADVAYDTREAIFWFRCADKQIKFIASQGLKEVIIADENNTFSVPTEGGVVEIYYQTNVECEVIIPEEAQSWISLTPATRALVSESATLTVAENTTYSERSAVVKVVAVDSEDLAVEYVIKQNKVAGFGMFRMEVTKNFVQIGVDHAYFLVYLDDVLVDHSELTFYDADDQEVTMTPYEVEIDGTTVTVPEWVPTKPETKSFWVSYKSYYTKELITITAVDFAIPEPMEDPQPNNLSFVKRTFFTQFTGAGCGYCPWAKAALYEAAADEAYADKFVVAAIYTYDGQTSKLYPTENGDISTAFGVSSYPTVIYDMIGSFSYEKVDKDYVSVKAAIDNTQKQEARAGIAVNVASDEGDTFVTRVSVKAAVDGEYNVGAWLVEDGINETQANYGCEYPTDFDNHNNVLRYADSGKKYTGHSLGAMKAGEVKDQVFAMTFKAPDPYSKKTPWVKENCRLIVFVTTSNRGSAYVTNVVANDIYSESIEFEYSN